MFGIIVGRRQYVIILFSSGILKIFIKKKFRVFILILKSVKAFPFDVTLERNWNIKEISVKFDKRGAVLAWSPFVEEFRWEKLIFEFEIARSNPNKFH